MFSCAAISLPSKLRSRIPLARLLLMFVITAWLVVQTTTAHAATIPVTTTAQGSNDDGACSLVEAILAANTNSVGVESDCVAGDASPTDFVVLASDATYSIANSYANYSGLTGLPSITSTVVISGNNATLTRAGSNQIRFFHVATEGNLTLNALTLHNGKVGAAGGAIYSEGHLALIDSQLLTNTANGGGGLYINHSTATISNTVIHGNLATPNSYGGALHLNDSMVTITNTTFTNNYAFRGGAIENYAENDLNSRLEIYNSTFITNEALTQGGAIHSQSFGTAYFDGLLIVDNRGDSNGGGLSTETSGKHEIVRSIFADNWGGNGGGIWTSGTDLYIEQTQFISNTARSNGGGIYASANMMTITHSLLLDNVVEEEDFTGDGAGDALGFSRATSHIMQSCIVGNTVEALMDRGESQVQAANNWWGAADGPSRAGSGAGDGIAPGMVYQPFLTGAPTLPNGIGECPTLTAQVTFGIESSTVDDLLPGQPLGYTLTVTNVGADENHNLEVNIKLPVGYQRFSTITGGADMVATDTGYRIMALEPAEEATIVFGGRVLANLTSDQMLTNTASISHSLTALPEVYVTNQVVLPQLSWSAATYTTDEGSNNGTFAATVMLTPPSPYAKVAVVAAIAGQPPQEINFSLNTISQTVSVDVARDGVIGDARVISLALQSPTFADLAIPSHATLTVADGDVLAMEIALDANTSTASINDTITYTYRITNSGTVDFDDGEATASQGGSIAAADLALSPQARFTTTHQRTITAHDLPGPLVNTLTVTISDGAGHTITRTASVTVNLTADVDLAVSVASSVAEAQVGQSISYTYHITNSGNLTHTTITATDEPLGALAELAGALAPSASRSATLTYVVQESDLPGPLINTVVVTGTNALNNTMVREASSTVAITDESNGLPFSQALPYIRP